MFRYLEKICGVSVFLFGLFVLTELLFAYYADCNFFPIKTYNSYGFIEKNTNATIIPLNKYPTRFLAQVALPWEYFLYKLNNKTLIKKYDVAVKKYGFQDDNNRYVIQPSYINANDFKQNYAVVSIYNKNHVEKFGTIDKNGDWVIEPKYSYLCPVERYYVRACIDKNHCGVIDRFGNQVITMSYSADKLNCEDEITCEKKFCITGNL